MKQTKYIITAVVALLVTTLLVAGTSSASFGGLWNKASSTNPSFDATRHTAVETAIDAGNYEAWIETMGDRPMVTKITADNFVKYAEAWKLMRDGKIDEAKIIMQELGIGMGRGMNAEFRGKQGRGMHRNQRDAHSGFVDANGDGICDHME